MITSTRPIELLKRFWWLIAALAAVGAAIGYIPEPTQAETAVVRDPFTATHTLTLRAGSSDQLSVPVSRFELYATRGDIPERVADQLEAVVGPIGAPTASFNHQEQTMNFTATHLVAEHAELIADTHAAEFVAYLDEQQRRNIETEREDLIHKKGVYLDDLERAETAARANPDSAVREGDLAAASDLYQEAVRELRALDETSVASSPLDTFAAAAAEGGGTREVSGLAPSSRRGRSLMGGFAGGVIGVGLAFVLTRTDRKIRHRDQVEQVLGMNVHVLVPDGGDHDENELVVVPGRHDPLSDAYRSLRSLISFSESSLERPDGRAPVVVVVSPSPGDGKTSSTANLAAAFAENSARTTLVNTDFRRPTLARRLGVAFPAPVGLDLNEIPHAPPELVLTPTTVPNLSIVDLSPLREHSPTDLARTTTRLLPRLASVCDAVVVDTSPIGATAEVLDLVPTADHVVLVVRLGNTTIQAARRSMEMIAAMSTANLLLVVVGGGPGDSGYYQYAYPSFDDETNGARRFGRKKR